MKWGHISTVPGDLKEVLGWDGVNIDIYYYEEYYGDMRWRSESHRNFGGYAYLTHWMKLPEPPNK